MTLRNNLQGIKENSKSYVKLKSCLHCPLNFIVIKTFIDEMQGLEISVNERRKYFIK